MKNNNFLYFLFNIESFQFLNFAFKNMMDFDRKFLSIKAIHYEIIKFKTSERPFLSLYV